MMNTQDISKLNPYKTMLLTFDPRRVYGWERAISNVLQVVTAAEPASYAIYGFRAIGKSTLLKYLKHPQGAVIHYEQYLHPDFARGGLWRLVWVYINFHELESDMHIFYVIYQAVYDELDMEDLLEDIAPPEPDPDLDENRTVRNLRKLLQKLDKFHQCRVVILMDDFDIPLMTKQVEKDEDRLLRTISYDASMVIATDDPISEIVPLLAQDSPLLGILSPQAIGLIEEPAARRLIKEPAAAVGVTYREREVDLLLNVAGRQPYLLTTACEIYFDMRPSVLDIDTMLQTSTLLYQLREQLMNRLMVLPHVNTTLNLMWSKHEAQRELLVEMGRAEAEGVVESKDAQHLVLRGMAYQDANTGNYRIFSSLLADFVRRQASSHEQNGANGRQDSLMQVAGTLKPIDRAVFEYLVDRRGEVCTFAELIKAVWPENEGTKRALEAAVHRLRRDMPPGHEIHNERGRGYIYVASEVESPV